MVAVIVAGVHYYQWQSVDRSSWGTGAGFGMFATVDYHGSRHFRCYEIKNGQETPMRLPDSIRRTIGLRARAMPTEGNINALAQAILETNWHLTSGGFLCSRDTLNSRGVETEQPIRIDSVRVELWAMKLDVSQRQLKTQILRQVSRHRSPTNNRLKDHVVNK